MRNDLNERKKTLTERANALQEKLKLQSELLSEMLSTQEKLDQVQNFRLAKRKIHVKLRNRYRPCEVLDYRAVTK